MQYRTSASTGPLRYEPPQPAPAPRVSLSWPDITTSVRQALLIALASGSLLAVLAGCGGTSGKSAEKSKQAELAYERRAASFARPPASVIAAAGPTAAARDTKAKAALLRAASDLQRYHRTHGTYAIGSIQNLHRLDPATALVDFVDGRDADFFLAVNPPTTTTIWRYNFDHDKAARVCGPGGSGCPPNRLW